MRIISIIYDQIIEDFLNLLRASNLSKNSVKFYKSDVLHFSNWVISEVKKIGVVAESFQETIPFLKPGLVGQYKTGLLRQKAPAATVNRRLSTIRKFSDYLKSTGVISFDLTQNLVVAGTQPSLIDDFAKHLREAKASPNTVKNYLADIRHFLNWLEVNYA